MTKSKNNSLETTSKNTREENYENALEVYFYLATMSMQPQHAVVTHYLATKDKDNSESEVDFTYLDIQEEAYNDVFEFLVEDIEQGPQVTMSREVTEGKLITVEGREFLKHIIACIDIVRQTNFKPVANPPAKDPRLAYLYRTGIELINVLKAQEEGTRGYKTVDDIFEAVTGYRPRTTRERALILRILVELYGDIQRAK